MKFKTIKELEAIERTPKFENSMIYYYMALKDVLGLIDELSQEFGMDKLVFVRVEELKARINGK